MKITKCKDISINIVFDCPHCGEEQSECLDREPDAFDTECTECTELFTVKCYGDI